MERYKKLQTSIFELQNQIKVQQDEIYAKEQEFNPQIKKKQDEIDTLTQQHKITNEDYHKTQNNYCLKITEHENLLTEHKSLKTKMSQNEQYQKEIIEENSNKTLKITNLTSEKDDLKNKIKKLEKQINEQSQELIELYDDLETQILETNICSKDLTMTHSRYQLGIMIASLCVIVFNVILCAGCGIFKCRREENEINEIFSEEKYGEVDERMASVIERHVNDAKSVERSRTIDKLSSFYDLPKPSCRIISKTRQLRQDENIDKITEWKLQNYFRVAYEEKKTSSDKTIEWKKEKQFNFTHVSDSPGKCSSSKCWSAP